MPTRKTTRKTRKPTRKTRKAPVAHEDLTLLESANHIWMAGVGALARAQKEGPKVFDNLVREGVSTTNRMRSATQKAVRGAIESVQDAVESRVDGARSQASLTIENVEKIVQTRVHRALHQLGVPTSDEVTALTRRVNELNRNVEALVASRRTPARRRPNGSKAKRGRSGATRSLQ